MSVMLRIADSCRTSRHFREGPEGDIPGEKKIEKSFWELHPLDALVARLRVASVCPQPAPRADYFSTSTMYRRIVF